ncbi:hypothetical protein QBC38DRAFT_244709 [Podospora fimiseda]|uniref:Uncharacterized protein n=1 Tax=Podospora fimiseda TaxID=252190 RepID=A0AAN7BXQ1_9PEZI|nr:hypothetical protein QBC38DRAFT_244709 [Podospora fimiseda]
MAPPTTAADELTSSVTKLSLNTTAIDTTTPVARGAPKKKKSAPIADSWEDEAGSDDDAEKNDSQSEPEETPISTTFAGGTNAPPPTPMSPIGKGQPFSPSALTAPGIFNGLPSFDNPGGSAASGASVAGKRPEKTDAVARRMIAAGLGLKAPRATEEQKAYDRAVREKEKKRREEEKEAARKREEEAAKAKQAVWDD